MLSLQQAIEIKESIVSYLKATFTFRKREVAQAFHDFIYHPEKGMFKGPYLSLKLRFVKADEKEIEQIPLEIKPNWPPYDHQVKAWHRLSTREHEPQPTIVTTGTGSGKTEAFLYPVLDYCYSQKDRPGIKVIIMYPMNALATDQAKRLGEMIFEDERLSGKIRAGLFIGEGKQGQNIQRNKLMGPDHIIEDRNTIIDSPPDILLTNFKMLDYGLMKHNYNGLWSHNMLDKGLFKFLVLDELHTYDGAQGTDVANLIRRLKLKLNMEEGQLCPVGTSATIGSSEEAPTLLADYAQKIFGETITEESIINENRVNVEDFFEEDESLLSFIPLPNKLKELVYHERDNFDDYLQGHVDAWQQDKENLSHGLRQLKIVKDLLTLFSRGKDMLTVEQVIQGLSVMNEGYRRLPQWDQEYSYSPKERVLESLLTLIAQARDEENSKMPFIYLQVQLWIRELSGVQYTLEEKPQFTFRDQVDAQTEISALPPWYCRECNSSGWLGLKHDGSDKFSKNISDIYRMFINDTQTDMVNKSLYYILPANELSINELRITGYEPTDFEEIRINPVTLAKVSKNEEGLDIQAVRKIEGEKSILTCPCCNSDNTTTVVGTKIPTLSSIAVSQTLATDLDSAEERNRKVLAFTNSVQDAAHQAGFVESRNYRFTLRASIQKVINVLFYPVRLSDLSDEFINYWKQNADSTGDDPLSGYLYRFFPKDYAGKFSPEDYKEKNGEYSDFFLKEFDLRIQNEIYSEFGFLSRIGRTLEKTGASSVCFDTDALERSWEGMIDWLEKNDVSHTIDKAQFIRFTNMVLHRSRNRGAIGHEYLSKFREERWSVWDLNWQKDSRHFLNPTYHAKRSRLPKLLTNQPARGGLMDSTLTKRMNWHHSYFIKSFQLAGNNTDFINEFYDQWLKALTEAGLLNSANSGEMINYAIAPEMIWVKKDVKMFCCDKCEDILYTQDDNKLIEGASCLSYRCTGSYKQEEQEESNYYKAVYNRNRFPRIYAAEHTGLLAREPREKLESDFKEHNRFNSVNTLIATSTLEMGIDIGDLNTAYNNSTPPLPANFLQRVGRAGRKSGASVIINFVKNQNHDLYYFADPTEMMEGEVNTPGCYLEAKDILRRHFMAYCFDSWTSNNPETNAIPIFVRDLKLGSSKLTEPNFFPNRVNRFIKDNKEELISRFLEQYTPLVRERAFKQIADDLDNESFYHNFLGLFDKIEQEIDEIEKKIKELKEEQRELNISKNDPLYAEFRKELSSLAGLKKSINSRNLLEHLTNVGVLPNYAFPETGVKLDATVWKSSGEEGGNANGESIPYEIVRPASQAIKELAPENFFYTQGYRFEISGINTFDWKDEDNSHVKRFCSKCDNLVDGLNKSLVCPKCGDDSWGSASNMHDFVRLTAVRSYNTSSKAKLDDRNDDRDNQLYQIMNHVNYQPDSSEGAWVLKEIPFGIEFVRNATITTVNYGRQDSIDSRRLKVNESDVMAKGFVTCRHCGKSVSATHFIKDAEGFHYGYCKHRNRKYEGQPDDVFREVYLFREIKTEILKIILPVQEFNTEADIRMFRAGLELGLKKYFKGNPGHIRMMDYKEYNQHTARFDRFLLLYDTIPGGSGYLEELFDNENFSELLRNSYESIRDCSCQQLGHDGCYKCIYSYGNQYNREGLSRARAESWFEKIYSRTGSWERNNQGLTRVTDTGHIEESELEERFVNLLSKWSLHDTSCKFEEKKAHGVIHYELSFERGDISTSYLIRPQVVLGPKDGIEYSTRVDFLIICTKYQFKENEYKNSIPHITLYLDGYQYHASAEHNVFEKDVAIRKAIACHNYYKVWTLTWSDLDYLEYEMDKEARAMNRHKDELFHYFNEHHVNIYNKVYPLLTRNKESVSLAPSSSNMKRLFDLLIYPEIKPWLTSRFAYLGTWTTGRMSPSFHPDELEQLVTGTVTDGNYIIDNKVKDFDGLIPAQYPSDFGFAKWRTWVNIGKEKIYGHLQLTDTSTIDKNEWQRFWSLFNIFQTDEFVEIKDESDSTNDIEALLDDVLPLYDDRFHALLKQAVELGIITADNIDFLDSLLDEKQDIIADGDLVLTDLKLVINPYSDESLQEFKKRGYSIFSLEDIKEINLKEVMNKI